MANLFPEGVVDRFSLEFLSRGDEAAADATMRPDARGITGLKPPGPIEGRAERKDVFIALCAAFHGVDPLRIADRVATRLRIRLRPATDFFGVAATNRVVLFDETHVARVREGLIVENVASVTKLEVEVLMAPALARMIDAAAAREAGR